MASQNALSAIGPSSGNDSMEIDGVDSRVNNPSVALSFVNSDKENPARFSANGEESFSPVEFINNAINRMSQDLVAVSLRYFGLVPDTEEDKSARTKYKAWNDDLQKLVSTRDALLASYVSVPGSTWTGLPSRQALSHVVPPNLPLMQWKGTVFNPSASVSVDVRDCLNKFQDLMACHGLSFDLNWRRLLPPCLSLGQRTWFMDYQEKETVLTWERFKQAFISHYGVGSAEEKAAATSEMLHISMTTGETLNHFVERFNNLRRIAHIQDACVVTRCFLMV